MLSMVRTGKGIILNAAHANTSALSSSKHIVEAAECARRIKDVLGSNNDVKVLLYTDKAIWMYMNDNARCKPAIDRVCRQYRELGGRRLFDIVKFFDDFSYPAMTDVKPSFRYKWPALWLKRAVGWLHSPFEKSMFFDTEVYVCPGFERMFDTYLNDHHLYAGAVAVTPFSNTNGNSKPLRAGIPAKEFSQYPERNLGVVLAQTGHPKIIELLTLFRDVYVRQINDETALVVGDQAAMREALFTMRIWVHDTMIPIDIGCRFTLGCDDGCLTIHRDLDRAKSGNEVRAQGYQAKKDGNSKKGSKSQS
jgi:hypothetical protein